MTTLAHRSVRRGPTNGGVAARRALVRWAWRMFRREWRQQLLVIALLTVAVAAAVGSITIAYNASPADNADFGSASTRLRFDGSDPRELAAGVAAAKKWFGTTDLIARSWVAVRGGVERLHFVAVDPGGPYVGDLLALRRGSYPTGADQVAVTDGVAELMRLELGSTLALDGRRRTVVGIVENRRKLSEEFALVTPSSASAPHWVTVLVDASPESVRAFTDSMPIGLSALTRTETRPNAQGENALAMFSVATVFLLLASLVAAAGFAVVAQRRLRQLGMLATVGATQKQLRLVALTNGFIVGAIAALGGTIVGLAVWVGFAPTLESAVDHRIDRSSLPWSLLALAVLLAILGATAAAWWPGRAAARLPVVLTLSGRPPAPRPARHAAIAAAVLIAVGMGCLVLSGRDRMPLIVVGIVATILGTLLLGPLAIRLVGGAATRASIVPRLALRDLVRYQARSGAALAALALALGIAATVVIVAAAEEAKRAAEPANLSDRQIRVHLGPSEAREATPGDALDRARGFAAGVRQLAAKLDQATVIPLRKAVQPGAARVVVDDTPVFETVELLREESPQFHLLAAWLFVATPAVLEYLGIDPASVDPDTHFLADPSVPTNELVIPNLTGGKVAVTRVERIEPRQRLFGSFDFGFNEVRAYMPPTFITLNGLRRRGWTQIPSTWLVESSRPLTSDQIASARDVAAQAGFTIEVRRERTSFARTMAMATAVGALLALGILAMTIGLIRSQSSGELRTLTATGATFRIRRTLTATTAGALALLGTLLGVAGAYLALTALYLDDLGYLSRIPVLSLTATVVGVPLIATAAGWLLAGREPPAIARTVIE